MKKYLSKLIVATAIPVLMGCSKEFLDPKPNKNIVVPTTVQDIQAILNNYVRMNRYTKGQFIGSGDYYTIPSEWNNYPSWEQNQYLWLEEPFGVADVVQDWFISYQSISYANVSLEQIKLLPANDSVMARQLRGVALFFRAHHYFALAELFVPTFKDHHNDIAKYIPIRLSPNINISAPRGTIKEVYDLIFSDLEEALQLLPESSPMPIFPHKHTANALLARIHLASENYDLAYNYARKVYEAGYELMDYNDFSVADLNPFPLFNQEVVFHSDMDGYGLNGSNLTLVDSNLYKSYDVNDLRRELFFNAQTNGNIIFGGSYRGDRRFFSGIGLDEIYLIMAECNARQGMIEEAMVILNSLLVKRWKTGTYVEFQSSSENDALKLILEERRKELAFRGTRWSDLRRLNKDPRFETTQVRMMDGNTYILSPNSLRYVLPIPPIELRFE